MIPEGNVVPISFGATLGNGATISTTLPYVQADAKANRPNWNLMQASLVMTEGPGASATINLDVGAD